MKEGAPRLFSENGYDATTVKDITDSADVAKGTFFNYFETKEAILPAVAAGRLEELKEALIPEHGAPESPVARIKLALRLVADDPLCEQQLAQRLFAAVMRHREIQPGHAFRDLLAEQVCQGQAVGEIRNDLDPLHIAVIIRSLFFQQLVTWHHGYRPAPLHALINSTVDLLMDGAAGPNWIRQP